MAKPKKKMLPKDFQELLQQGDIDTLKAVFVSCDVNARSGYTKQTALAYNDCPDELVRWLVAQGADLMAEDDYGETPLHARSGHWQGRIEILIELGADINHGENRRGTPLHMAAAAFNPRTAKILLQNGARASALNREKETPLVYALQRCTNTDLENMVALTELLLEADPSIAPKSGGLLGRLFGKREQAASRPDYSEMVTRIGSNFEFHRSNFNPELLDAASAALDRLYTLFNVAPVARRVMHDGKATIAVTAAKWEDRHQQYWELLVPSNGAAATVQGEVIRISGRINDELQGNGGINWDSDYKKMADILSTHLASGKPLSPAELAEAAAIIKDVKGRRGDTVRLCELATKWVDLNPQPVKLPPPDYQR